MSLRNNWKTISEYDGRAEFENFPICYAKGKHQSNNSSNENLATIAEYIRQDKPRQVLECGTFEGRTTEYLATLMGRHVPGKYKLLVTIDVEGCIKDITEDSVTYQDDIDYEDVIAIRSYRLALLQRHPTVRVIYESGLTQHLLLKLLKQIEFNFIYEDACHVPNILIKDWEAISQYARPRCVVCFDDMANNPFKDWLYENAAKEWDIYYSDIERGQIWAERKLFT